MSTAPIVTALRHAILCTIPAAVLSCLLLMSAMPSTTVQAQADPTTYIVQPGDTLSAIAKRFGVTMADLMTSNGLTDPDFVFVGQRLRIAVTPVAATPSPTPRATVAPTRAATPTALPPTPTALPTPAPTVVMTTIYTVQRGDTLSAIALRFRTTVGDLLRRNGMGNADLLNVGQRLEVPIPPALLDPSGAGGTGSEAAPTRIQFAAGATSASVEGLLTFPQRSCYVLGADAGQELTVALSSGSDLANFLVRAADTAVNGGVPLKRLENEDRRWQYTLPASGDYIVCVATPEGAVAYTLTVTIPAACTSITQAIEVVDWATRLDTDPALTTALIGGDPYVTVTASGTGTAGIPQLEQIVYGDFDGDCMEEAAVPLFSGGTAGNVGFLVYNLAEETAAPTLVAWRDGYKLGLAADAGLLVVSSALYNGWEPNCCPSGIVHEGYRLRADDLVLVYSSSEGLPEMAVETVRHFYEVLQAQDYTTAYAFLAPEFQGANPFATWAAGYGNTQSFEATVAADPEVVNRVTVTLAVTESLNNGLTRLRHYSGYWDVVWDGVAPGWRLQEGHFTVVP